MARGSMARLGLPTQLLLVLSLLLSAPVCLEAFYLPGVAPREYQTGAAVELKVNKLTSAKAQLPFGYYTLPFCRPKQIEVKQENLGELLMGDQIQNSPFEIGMMVNESCKLLCRTPLDEKKREIFRGAIDDEYMVHWIVDNMPSRTKYMQADGEARRLPGFPVGVNVDGKYHLHNHVRITLLSHTNPGVYSDYRIVGFEVEPDSVVQSTREDADANIQIICPQQRGETVTAFRLGKNSEVIFTYDVVWVESAIRWASRWDSYLEMTGGRIHWFSIMNSLLIVLGLTGMVLMILLRTLFRDIAKYNEVVDQEEAKEETGWKLVHADVFREPKHSTLLVVSVGSGVQLLGMAVVTLIFALFGFLSPARRGELLQSMMLLFTFMGLAGGYAMSRIYVLFGKINWQVPTFLTAVLYPSLMFVIFFFLNLMIWGQHSSGAVPFMTMFTMLVLWFGVSVPLVFLGAYFGFRKPAPDLPVRVSKIPRTVPELSLIQSPVATCIVGGILPFGAVFTELFFIMSSIWQHQFYYLFGFLALVLLILVLTCTMISIALTYFQLSSEDYNWWWRSFLNCASSGIYCFLNSVMYYNSRLNITHLSGALLFFGYMAIMSICFCLLTGSIGTISSYLFVRAIYGSIKID